MDTSRLIRELSRPGAFPHPADDLRSLRTHVSVVFLAGRWVTWPRPPSSVGWSAARRRSSSGSDASDADRSVLHEMASRWEPPSAAVERWTYPLDTEAPVSDTVEAARAILAREGKWSRGAGSA